MLSSPTTTSDEVFKAQRKNKKKDDNSRRFSDEQIKSLESVFKMENKLEPKKKLEMARELGLQPRQVAIWFQNRRARWKSKQVEHDYTNLKADYDNLSNRFESLKKEKHDLLHQLSNLCSRLKEPDHEGSKDLASSSEDGEMNGNSSGPLADEEDDPSQKDVEDMNMAMGVSDEKVSNFEMGGLFDQSCSNWWDIWS